ncbi:MAG TPA: hypothetical protein DIT64_22705 [Verrucomicrobiales bacterium]|nr:hypothetical protein [Verrucomicrobiales bacterium]HRJ07715.1 3D domain-containing protein [Prosthecobacter sp.]HRK13617.1 3D domain-containing protein [Prosthecobacter sp.]
MKVTLLLCWVSSISMALSVLSSCALPQGGFLKKGGVTAAKGSPLQPGVRYEVRKALQAGVPFRPQEMKRYFFVIETPRPPMMAAANAKAGQMTVRTTAYCHDESDHIVYGRKNALGTDLKFGSVRSAAADWSRYPVGTRFRIAGQPDVVYEVDDYGSALVGTGTIDLYKPTQGMMNQWGVRHVDIEVLQWGSYERSMEIMRDRVRWPHVRRMVSDIESNVMQATMKSLKPQPLAAAL